MTAPSLYADLSHYYDLLCAHIDYEGQYHFAARANKLLGNGGLQYLDMACGSGALLEHFYKAGFDCSGVDISAHMLALATERCPKAHWMCADMGELHADAPVDFITCFLYSIHYSASLARLQQTFDRVFAVLAPGGVFCFDAVDKDSIANDQGHCHTLVNQDCFLRFQTRWHYEGSGDALVLHIDIQETLEDRKRHYTEQHHMTTVSVPVIANMLRVAGFEVVILEHDLERLCEWQGINGNVLFCAIKSVDGPGPGLG